MDGKNKEKPLKRLKTRQGSAKQRNLFSKAKQSRKNGKKERGICKEKGEKDPKVQKAPSFLRAGERYRRAVSKLPQKRIKAALAMGAKRKTANCAAENNDLDQKTRQIAKNSLKRSILAAKGIELHFNRAFYQRKGKKSPKGRAIAKKAVRAAPVRQK